MYLRHFTLTDIPTGRKACEGIFRRQFPLMAEHFERKRAF